MSDDELKAIEARANAASDGTWVSDADFAENGSVEHTCPEHGSWYCVSSDEMRISHDSTPEDSRFIAHAREDIPKLIAEVRRLREERDVEHRKWKTLALAERLHKE